MDLLRSLMVVLESISQGIHVVDENGITVVYNRVASLLDGLSKDEVVGKRLLDVYPSLDHNSSTLLRVLKTGVPEFEQQQTFTNYKGKKITTINSTYPIELDGKVVGACEVSTDITRIKEMSEKILDLRRELRHKGDSRTERTGPQSQRLYTVDDIVGLSQAMLEVKSRIGKVAKSNSSVMVWGETGTGKELVVQSIHSASTRWNRPFVAQNCAAIPESLLEGLMFGTSKGSFTGSVDRPGLFELASGGTLYLDEIDSMPLGLQAKLLRVIQEKVVRRVGDTRERQVDARIISSCSVPPRQAVASGLLRQDLYFRLAVVEITLPPLRERREDIPLLCEHFLRKHSPQEVPAFVSPQVMSAFLTYDWPGNVRELEHAIEGSLALARGPTVDIGDIPPVVRGILATASLFGDAPSPAKTFRTELKEQERAVIVAALKQAGSVSGAARLLGMPRQTLQYRIKTLGI